MTVVIPPELVPSYQKLTEEVHRPVFLQKLASDYGIVPQSVEEEAALRELAGILQVQYAQEQIKQASAVSPLVAAVDELKQGLRQHGHNMPLETSHEQAIKSAAAQLAQDEELVQAAELWSQYTASLANEG